MLKINLFPEKWKVIPDYPDYAVSNLGRVMRVTLSKNRFAHTYPGRLLKPLNTRGYLHLSLCKNKKSKTHRIAHLVALCFLGLCPPGKQINHKNGVKTDNRVNNLEYVTQKQNNEHALSLGLWKSRNGELNPGAKLKEKDIVAIIDLRKAGWPQQRIANKFHVHQMTISLILSGKTWSSVTGIK